MGTCRWDWLCRSNKPQSLIHCAATTQMSTRRTSMDGTCCRGPFKEVQYSKKSMLQTDKEKKLTDSGVSYTANSFFSNDWIMKNLTHINTSIKSTTRNSMQAFLVHTKGWHLFRLNNFHTPMKLTSIKPGSKCSDFMTNQVMRQKFL